MNSLAWTIGLMLTPMLICTGCMPTVTQEQWLSSVASNGLPISRPAPLDGDYALLDHRQNEKVLARVHVQQGQNVGFKAGCDEFLVAFAGDQEITLPSRLGMFVEEEKVGFIPLFASHEAQRKVRVPEYGSRYTWLRPTTLKEQRDRKVHDYMTLPLIFLMVPL